ncbi:RNA-dependent ATPase [Tulasnella sp. 424]|nr:RNA-dependent ATPase [Tulasnella sp. 424]KAG8976013.1 RNA-dependent ATPase [Tulasnella sp. 425]
MGKSKRHATEENGELTRAAKKPKLDTAEGTVDLDDDSEKARLKAERKERKRLKKLAKEAKGKGDREGGEDTAVEQGEGTASPAESEVKKKKKKSKKIDAEDASALPAGTAASTTVPSRATTVQPASSAESSEFLASNSIKVLEGEVVPVISFDQLAIPDKLRPALSKFAKPTPIQSCSWPAALAGKDVVGIAETGSGKTLAFALPAVTGLLKESASDSKKKQNAVSILVLSPTRELAIQSHETFKDLAEPFGFTSVCVYGGAPKHEQRASLKGSKTQSVRIIVATPGRLIDFLDEGAISLKGVSYLVLDEADRMLDNGFENDIRKIIGETVQGEGRQTLMFSATWPESVRRLAASFQRNPVRITVGSDDLTANSRVEQVVEVIGEREKRNRLEALLKSVNHPKQNQKATNSRILVFCLYKKEASRVEENLKWLGYNVAAIHGDLRQSAREQALGDFKDGTAGLLVATDVAARGLDIPNVSMVINYTFPLTVEDYVHRIGRTGRGGKSGKSHTFFTGENHERALAGELARVLADGGFKCDDLKQFPMTIKKREHSAYGAFYKDTREAPTAGTKIKFG